MSYKYTVNKAEDHEIYAHLTRCSDMFFPALQSTVNIGEYSKKIISHSSRFEAWSEDHLIGLVAVYMNNIESGTAFITNVSVDREYNGRGVAKHLLKNCIEAAKKDRFKKLELEVSKINVVAIGLYKTFGFTHLLDGHSDSDKLLLQLQIN